MLKLRKRFPFIGFLRERGEYESIFMAYTKLLIAQLSIVRAVHLSRPTLRSSVRFLNPFPQQRHQSSNPQRAKKPDAPKSKRKQRDTFVLHDLKDAEQFSLCDAMRYDVVHVSILEVG